MVVERLLDMNHPIQDMASSLSKVASLLKADPDDVNGFFLDRLIDLSVQLLSESESMEFIKKQEDKMTQMTLENTQIKEMLETGRLQLKDDYSKKKHLEDLSNEIDSVIVRNSQVCKELEAIGFREELVDASIQDLEEKVRAKKEELNGLLKQLDKFSVLKEVSNNGLREATQQLRKEHDVISDRIRSMSIL